MVLGRLRVRARVVTAGCLAAVAVLVVLVAPGTASAQGQVQCNPAMKWSVEPLDVTVEQGAVATFKLTVTNQDNAEPPFYRCSTYKTRVQWLLPNTVDQTPVADVDGDASPCGFHHCDLGGLAPGVTRVVTVRVRAGESTGDSQIKFGAWYETRDADGSNVSVTDLPDYTAQMHIVPATVRDETPPVVGKVKLTRTPKSRLVAHFSLSESMEVEYEVQYLAEGRLDGSKCKKYVRKKKSQPTWSQLPKSQRCRLWSKVRLERASGVEGKNNLVLAGKVRKDLNYRVIVGGTDLADNPAKPVISSVSKATK